MSSTFSVNIGHITETTRKSDIFSAIQAIPDNTVKLITPRDVRDAIYTTWASIPFKHTRGTGTIEYIGIDSGNPESRDIKQKILIGKRSFGGLDVMNNTLLNNNNADIFIYNTKSDSDNQDITKLAILTGTTSFFHQNSPFIQSRIDGVKINFELINPAPLGPINILSNTGRISINGISFPTLAENSNITNGKILRYVGNYPNGFLRWDDPTVTIANIGSTTSTTNIQGDPILINGQPIEFVDNTPVPQKVGGININDTFPVNGFNGQKWPVVEVVRRILYPYIPPVLSFSVINSNTGTTYGEIGVSSTISISYSTTRTSNDINNFRVRRNNSTTIASGSNIGLPNNTVGSTVTQTETTTGTYSLEVSDSGLSTFSYSTIASITFVRPVMTFVTTTLATSTNIDNVISNSAISKVIRPQPTTGLSFFINYSNSGFFYYIQPNTFAQVRTIKDPNGYIVHDSGSQSTSAFTHSVFNVTHMGTIVAYRVYRTINQCSYSGNGLFEFIY
jgi:hypothetical protein